MRIVIQCFDCKRQILKRIAGNKNKLKEFRCKSCLETYRNKKGNSHL